MPYTTKKLPNGKVGVYKKDAEGNPTGDALYEHPSQDKADAQIAAMEISLHKQGKKEMLAGEKMGDMMSMSSGFMSPKDKRANYDPMGATATEACANCEWFMAHCNGCKLLYGAVVATGICDLWLGEEPEPGAMLEPTPMPVYMVDAPSSMMEGESELRGQKADDDEDIEQPEDTEDPEEEPDFVDDDVEEDDGEPEEEYSDEEIAMDEGSSELRPNLIREVVDWLRSKVLGNKEVEEVTTGFKALPDRMWYAWWTNNAKDDQGETFSQKSLDDYIDRVDSGKVPMPELWWWHMPIRSGKALWIGREGHIGMAVGTFDEGQIGDAFYNYYSSTKDNLRVSHGYLYPRGALVDGVYHWFNTFEISPLPAVKAANRWTSFQEIKSMPQSAEKIESLRGILKDETLVANFLKDAELKSKEVEAYATGFKESDDKEEFIATVDEEARAGIKSLTDETLPQMLQQVKELAGVFNEGIKAMRQIAQDQENRLKALEGDRADLAPRATQSQKTVVDPTKNAQMAFLQQKQNEGSKENQSMGIFDNILSVLPNGGKE